MYDSDFLNFSNSLADEKFGFREDLSVDKGLLRFTDDILCALNNRMHAGGIPCDFSKAF
jgi:hypothetical protein